MEYSSCFEFLQQFVTRAALRAYPSNMCVFALFEATDRVFDCTNNIIIDKQNEQMR